MLDRFNDQVTLLLFCPAAGTYASLYLLIGSYYVEYIQFPPQDVELEVTYMKVTLGRSGTVCWDWDYVGQELGFKNKPLRFRESA